MSRAIKHESKKKKYIGRINIRINNARLNLLGVIPLKVKGFTLCSKSTVPQFSKQATYESISKGTMSRKSI